MGGTLAIIIIGGILSSFLVLFVNASGLDPFYFVFEEFLPSAYDRPNWIILTVFPIRFLMTWIIVLESIRLMALFFGTLFAGSYFFSTSSKLFWLFPDEGGVCKWMFLQLRILYYHFEEPMNLVTMCLMVINQITLVFMTWFVIVCRDYFSNFLFFALCAVDLYVVVGTAVLISASGSVGEKIRSVIEAKRVFYFHPNKNLRKSYFYYSFWRAQQPCFVKCGSMFILEKTIPMTYFKVLVDNLVNAVLLIEP